jgi:hypothetical protein
MRHKSQQDLPPSLARLLYFTQKGGFNGSIMPTSVIVDTYQLMDVMKLGRNVMSLETFPLYILISCH